MVSDRIRFDMTRPMCNHRCAGTALVISRLVVAIGGVGGVGPWATLRQIAGDFPGHASFDSGAISRVTAGTIVRKEKDHGVLGLARFCQLVE